MAGGPAACAPAADVSGLYIGADVGAAYNTELDIHSTSLANTSRKHTPWGWTASGLVGYQYNNNLALQFGYIWYQEQKLQRTATTDLKFNHYDLYLSLKGMVPLMDQLSAYMMVGPAYSHAKAKTNGSAIAGSTSLSGTAWVPMGALGFSYAVDENVKLNLEYMFLFGNTRSVQSEDTSTISSNQLVADANTQRLTVGATYLFAM
jgi:hypothetical protein